MLVMGDLKCLHCGFDNGRWVGAKGTAPTLGGLRPRLEGEFDPNAPARCQRCAGPVFLDDASPVMNSYRLRRIQRMREQLAALDAQRRTAA